MKDFMETLRGVGCTIGEMGEADTTAPSTPEDDPVDADPVIERQCAEEDEDDGDDKYEVDDPGPLLRLQDSASIPSTSLTLLPKSLTLLQNSVHQHSQVSYGQDEQFLPQVNIIQCACNYYNSVCCKGKH